MKRWLKRIRTGTFELPGSWGAGRFEIHSSLLVTLLLMSCLLLGLSFYRSGFEEFRTVVVSLPIIWLVSLIVRIAAQHLAIGEFAREWDTVVGPTGNLQTDYEYLPPRAMLAYAVSGQLASLGLVSLGLVINAAMTPVQGEALSTAEVLGFYGGWESRAWATQIFWVNMFMIGLHLLPTVPFDNRACVFAFFSWRSRTAQEPFVFRSIAAFDSHLAAMLLGIGGAVAICSWALHIQILGWYAAIAAAVYLFVASQWESARAEELEEQYMPTPTRLTVPASGIVHQPHLEFGNFDDEPLEDDSLDLIAGESNAADLGFGVGSGNEEPMDTSLFSRDTFDDSEGLIRQATGPDVDEILRKVHRQGVAALTDEEQQALLSASEEINHKRGTPK